MRCFLLICICIYLISGVNIFLDSSCGSPSCYQINTLPDTWSASIFSPPADCLPSAVGGLCGGVVSFDAGLLIFVVVYASVVISIKSLPGAISYIFLMVSSRGFIVSDFKSS